MRVPGAAGETPPNFCSGPRAILRRGPVKRRASPLQVFALQNTFDDADTEVPDVRELLFNPIRGRRNGKRAGAQVVTPRVAAANPTFASASRPSHRRICGSRPSCTDAESRVFQLTCGRRKSAL